METRFAHRADLAEAPALVEEGVARDGFREPVGVGEPRVRKRAQDPLDERQWHLLPAVDDQSHAREVPAAERGMGQELVHHRRRQPDGRDRAPLERVEGAGRVERPVDLDGAAGVQHRGRREVQRAHVVERAAREPPVGAGDPELDDVRDVLPVEVRVRDHDALGPPGRARRIHEPVDVVPRHRLRGRGVAGLAERLEGYPACRRAAHGHEPRPWQVAADRVRQVEEIGL
jgi:hypothetical protein